MNMNRLKCKSIHEKAIRLLEGGVVEVDGLYVMVVGTTAMFDLCDICEMDSLCHIGTEMCEVCKECDSMTVHYNYLKLVNEKR